MRFNTDEWKEFRVGDWFTVDCCTGYDAGIIGVNKIKTDEFPYEFIGRTSDNYGLQGYVKELNSPINKKNTISISQVGTIVAQYRKNDYYTSQNMFKLTAIDRELSEVQSLFVTSVLNKMLTKYTGYSSYPTKGDLINELILLPPKNNEPDWDFMEEYIKEIEEKYIEQIDKYNQENIQKALSVVGITEDELDKDLVIEPADRYEEFKIEKLFDGLNGDFDIKQEHINNKGDIVITSGLENNGVLGKTDVDARVVSGKTLTVDMFGNVFYRPYTYKMVTHARVFALVPKFEMNDNIGLFMVTVLFYLRKMYSYSHMCSFNKIKKEKILLPAIDKETPDFEYMEKAIYIYIYILRKSLRLGKWIMKKKSML